MRSSPSEAEDTGEAMHEKTRTANTAVAAAEDPVKMAEAFKLAVRAAELALLAGPPAPRTTASASSPMNAFDIFK